jgi:hypothetical protein
VGILCAAGLLLLLRWDFGVSGCYPSWHSCGFRLNPKTAFDQSRSATAVKRCWHEREVLRSQIAKRDQEIGGPAQELDQQVTEVSRLKLD